MARESKFTKDDLYRETKDLLLNLGYAGFHFGLLADQLDITRAALYKYYDNKDELITEYMNYEMSCFLDELKKITQFPNFDEQMDYLLTIIFKYSEIHQLLRLIFQIPKSSNAKVSTTLDQLQKQHTDLYHYLNQFIELGRKENTLKDEFPNQLILGFIFETVNIPNHSSLAQDEWKKLIKEFLYKGMTK